MPIYTILGGTGSTGSAVIRSIIASPPADLTLRIFVRSKSKLLNILPELSARPDTKITEAEFTDQQALGQCLSDSDAIFSCIATNDSAPDLSIALDTAAAIISALQDVKKKAQGKYVKPVILMLSSASVSKTLDGSPPAPVKAILDRALWFLYEDLRKAESLYRDCRQDDAELLDVIFIQAPGIMPGTVPTGHEISTKMGTGVVSFADLGAGMIETAVRREELEWREVSVLATGKVDVDWGPNIKHLLTGLVAYCSPGIWRLGRGWGLW